MSLDIFKQNMLSYMQNQNGIGSYSDFAKKLTQEYDAACKRGFESVNQIKIQKGNTELMESIITSVLANALQQSSGEHPIITNLGQGFVGYWTGAQMSLSPPPIIPSPGSVSNIAQTSNNIVNPGIWQPTDTLSLEPIIEEPPKKSVEQLLQEIPDDNNTIEGATEVVEETGVDILDDDGEDAGPQIEAIKDKLSEGYDPDAMNPVTYDDSGEPITTDELNEPAGGVRGKSVKCGVGFDYTARLSTHYQLRNLSLDVTFPHKIKAQAGLSTDEIVCNLKAVAENILEPLRAQYPKIKINSAFRGTASIPGGISQHQKGEAVDIQIPGLQPKDYLPVAKWIIKNLPFDQLIFEHGKSIWLHISHKRNGTQRYQQLTMYKGKYKPGLKLYY